MVHQIHAVGYKAKCDAKVSWDRVQILANPDISRVIRPFFRVFFSVTKYINATFDNMNKYAFKCMQNFKQNIFTQITGLTKCRYHVCRQWSVSWRKFWTASMQGKFTFAGELLSIVFINVIAFINAFPRPADSELLLKSDIFLRRMVFTCF